MYSASLQVNTINVTLTATTVPGAASAQLTLVTWNGTAETPVGATYNVGNVTEGTSSSVVFRIVNSGTASVTVTTLALSGIGFTLSGAPSGQPIIAPANFLEFTVYFSSATQTPAMYSASLQVNTINVILIATTVPGPELTILSGPCTASSSVAISFGNIQNGSLHLCNFSLSNPNPQTLTISTLSVTGGFQGAQIPPTPLTLPPGQAITFVAQVTPPCGTTSISGSILVGTQTFALTAAGFNPLLPAPSISFDATTFASAQQHAVSISLPTPAACAASGYLNLGFAVARSVTGVTDDTSVVFLQGSTRSLPFSVAANQTAVSIDGESAAMFQTGSTEGTLTFTMSGAQFSGNPTTTITIPPAPITIDAATASNQVMGQLNIEVVGFDNTYSAGPMTFTFFDTTGKPIGSPVSVDFTAQFQGFFTGQLSGSSFLLGVSFPVVGNQALVGTVQVTLTNAAGQAQTGTLTFQ
jgi:hypothetical protein